MTRRYLLVIALTLVFWPVTVEAQHHHGVHGFYYFSPPYGSYPMYLSGSYWPQNIQVVSYAYPIAVAPVMTPATWIPPKSPVAASTPAARMKSIEHQMKGDQRMREQKWSDAKMAYSDSVKAAPDRAEAHFRLAFGYLVIRRYESAINEFKRALHLDPSIPKTAKKLDTIFGPNGKIAVNSIISKLGDWVGEDLQSSDRLFLLGAVLYFNRDPRANDAFQAAIRVEKNPNADMGHISAFLNSPGEPGANAPQPLPDGLPQLKDKPAAPAVIPEDVDVRFPKSTIPNQGAPVPMPPQ